MGVQINRKKKKTFWLSFFYHFQKIWPMSKKQKFKLFLQWEWIFDRLAHEMSFSNYKVDDHPFRKYSFRFIIENLPPNSRILDLGSNNGDISFHLSKHAQSVVGVDHNPILYNLATKIHKAHNLEFIQSDAVEYLNKKTKDFDVLILSHILEHLDDREEFLNKFKVFFKFIYIEVPDFDKTFLNHYRKDLNDELIYTDDDHVIEFDRFELEALLKKCGLKIVASEYRFGIQKIWCETKES